MREVYKYNFVNVRYGNEKGRLPQLFSMEQAKWTTTMSSGYKWVGEGARSHELRLCTKPRTAKSVWQQQIAVCAIVVVVVVVFSSFLAARNI